VAKSMPPSLTLSHTFSLSHTLTRSLALSLHPSRSRAPSARCLTATDPVYSEDWAHVGTIGLALEPLVWALEPLVYAPPGVARAVGVPSATGPALRCRL